MRDSSKVIEQATRDKLAGLTDPDPWLVELAMALARLMDSDPTSAVAKELRAVVDLLTTSNKIPGTTLDDQLRRAEVEHTSNAEP